MTSSVTTICSCVTSRRWARRQLGPRPRRPGCRCAAAAVARSRCVDDGRCAGCVEPAATVVAVVDDVIGVVTSIVAEMTGYPPELLEPDLDLEADLGVDTVKQAEVFAAVRGALSTSSVTTICSCVISRRWARRQLGPRPRRPGSPLRPSQRDRQRVQRRPASRLDPTPRAWCTGTSTRSTRCHAGFPSRRCGPASRDCSADRDRARRGDRVVVMLDEGGVGDALVKQLRRPGSTVAAHWHRASPPTPSSRSSTSGTARLRSPASTGSQRSTTTVIWPTTTSAAGGRPSGGAVKALYAAMRHLYDVSPFLVICDPARRLPRLRRRRRHRPPRRVGRRLHEVVQEGAAAGARQGGRLLAVSRKTTAIADAADRGDAASTPAASRSAGSTSGRFGVAFVEAPVPERAR